MTPFNEPADHLPADTYWREKVPGHWSIAAGAVLTTVLLGASVLTAALI